MVYICFRDYYMCLESVLECFQVRYVLENFGDYRAFWGDELHRRVWWLAMDGDLSKVRLSPYFDKRYIWDLVFQWHCFEVNPTVRSEVILIVLKSGQSASPEEAVEEMKERRSTVHPWCRSTVIPEVGRAYFVTNLGPEVTTYYKNTPGRPETLLYHF